MRETLTGLLDRVRSDDKREELLGDLMLPDFPEAGQYLWDVFLRIRRRKRTDGMGNPQPIELLDFAAFNSLSGLRLRPWEIEILEKLDDVYLIERAKARES